MRGRPSIQLALVFLAFALLGVPVWRLTRTDARAAELPAPSSLSPPVTPVEELTLTAAFAPAPEEFRVQSLGRDVLAGHGPPGEFTGTWKTDLPAAGLDLALQARWPSTDAPGAVRVTVRFADDRRPPVEKTFWANRGSLTELVTVPGTAAP